MWVIPRGIALGHVINVVAATLTVLVVAEYFSIFLEYDSKIFVHIKLCFKFARSNEVVAYGVIGNTAGFGPVVLGSSPSRPTLQSPDSIGFRGFLFFRYNIGTTNWVFQSLKDYSFESILFFINQSALKISNQEPFLGI